MPPKALSDVVSYEDCGYDVWAYVVTYPGGSVSPWIMDRGDAYGYAREAWPQLEDDEN